MRRFWNYITEKQQLSLRNKSTEELSWRVNISPLALFSSLAAFIVVVIGTLMLLMAYTSMLDIFPGYRTKTERINDELTRNIVRLDAMEQRMEDSLKYNEVITAILSGNTPTLHSTVMTDTIRYDKSTVLPTRADTLLRKALESTTSKYSLANTKPLRAEAAMFSAPMRGNITRSFDAPESSYDIALQSIGGDDSVMAVENGTVIGIERNGDTTYAVTIQHGEGYVSIYKYLGESLVRKGQHVTTGAVIGHLRSAEDRDKEQTLELGFELWRDGTAVNPERYILF